MAHRDFLKASALLAASPPSRELGRQRGKDQADTPRPCFSPLPPPASPGPWAPAFPSQGSLPVPRQLRAGSFLLRAPGPGAPGERGILLSEGPGRPVPGRLGGPELAEQMVGPNVSPARHGQRPRSPRCGLSRRPRTRSKAGHRDSQELVRKGSGRVPFPTPGHPSAAATRVPPSGRRLVPGASLPRSPASVRSPRPAARPPADSNVRGCHRPGHRPPAPRARPARLLWRRREGERAPARLPGSRARPSVSVRPAVLTAKARLPLTHRRDAGPHRPGICISPPPRLSGASATAWGLYWASHPLSPRTARATPGG